MTDMTIQNDSSDLALTRGASAPPELLSRLAESHDWRVRYYALARNPSAPPELRKRLWETRSRVWDMYYC